MRVNQQQWRAREREQLTPAERERLGLAWAEPLAQWLEARGFALRERGSYNPATGRGWYSHLCEYGLDHVRVEVNAKGIMILRDPGCTMQLTRLAYGGMREQWTPNALRLDSAVCPVPSMIRAVRDFQRRLAYTYDEAEAAFRPAGVAW